MEQILGIFGIDWRLLLINAVNFALVIFVLWYFLYGPILRVLEERRERVAQGVRDADAAAAARKEVEASRGRVLAEAGREADEVLDKARAAAALREREMVAQGEHRAAGIVSDAQKEAQELKARALEESKQEVAKLVVLGVEKVMAAKQ
jgi:F-type H+-transporting ATPase subunit b